MLYLKKNCYCIIIYIPYTPLAHFNDFWWHGDNIFEIKCFHEISGNLLSKYSNGCLRISLYKLVSNSLLLMNDSLLLITMTHCSSVIT